jgi:hypothetical protein
VSRLLAFVRTRAGFVAATIGIVLAIAGVAAALVPRGTAPQTRSVQPTLPAPTTATTPLGDVDRELRRLPFGRISFTVPDSLELGDTFVLRLVLSLQESVSGLQRRISEIARQRGIRVRVSDEMEARLTGFGFTITAINPERQLVSRYATTTWSWDLKAAEVGVHQLHLSLSALLDAKNGQTPRTVRTFDTTLTVRVTWFDRTRSFISDNWQWLLTAILLPLAGWIVASRRKPTQPKPH